MLPKIPEQHRGDYFRSSITSPAAIAFSLWQNFGPWHIGSESSCQIQNASDKRAMLNTTIPRHATMTEPPACRASRGVYLQNPKVRSTMTTTVIK